MNIKLSAEEINELMEIVEKKNLCVFPDQQTFECCDCTICRIEYRKRLILGQVEICKKKSFVV